ncbi:MAG: glycosyltransferase [bacterium]|nr:glycosyltransferase [bacterium]
MQRSVDKLPGDPAGLRVLHFGRFFNDNFGGIERHVMLLLEELNQQPGVKADNLVAADRLKSEVLPVANYRVHKVASFGVLASTALAPLMLWRARRLIKSQGYQIAHLHFPDPLTALCARFFPRNTKIVISWHSDVIRQTTLLRLLKPIVDPIIRRAHAIVGATPGHFSSSTQLKVYPHPDQMRVIPYGLRLADYAETPAIKAGAQALRDQYPGKKIVFAIGRHIYYKGFEYLIQAMVDLPEAVLLLGGRGPLTAELKALAEKIGVADRVVFTGRIPDEQLVEYYYACDVYCMPSVAQSEAFGIVQVEAMACKKPVVCCELDNGVTYVNRHEETGLVVEPRNPAALGAALGRLFADDTLRHKLGKQAYDRAWSEFTTENMGTKMLALYRSLLA